MVLGKDASELRSEARNGQNLPRSASTNPPLIISILALDRHLRRSLPFCLFSVDVSLLAYRESIAPHNLYTELRSLCFFVLGSKRRPLLLVLPVFRSFDPADPHVIVTADIVTNLYRLLRVGSPAKLAGWSDETLVLWFADEFRIPKEILSDPYICYFGTWLFSNTLPFFIRILLHIDP